MRVKFIYDVHRIKVKVTGAKRSKIPIPAMPTHSHDHGGPVLPRPQLEDCETAHQSTRLDLREHFFSQRVTVVNEWNSLPQHVLEASTVNMFKNRLDKYWRDMSNKSDA